VVTEDGSGDVVGLEWSVGNAKITYDGTGAVVREEAFGSAAGTTIRVVDHASGEYLYHDARSHLLAAFDDDGTMLAGFRHGPYGELLDELGTQAEAFEKRFNGKERDDTSGLTYYGWRYYDEHALVWTQSDPKYRMATDIAGAQPRHASLYAFSLGNPVRFMDPDGLDEPQAPPHHEDPTTNGVAAKPGYPARTARTMPTANCCRPRRTRPSSRRRRRRGRRPHNRLGST
jgi:RHS repeat-associated protein